MTGPTDWPFTRRHAQAGGEDRREGDRQYPSPSRTHKDSPALDMAGDAVLVGVKIEDVC